MDQSLFWAAPAPRGVFDLLARTALVQPERPFLKAEGRVWSYGETAEAARRLAGWLSAQGVRRGDRVAIFCENRAETAIAVFAAALMGGIFVVLNPQLRPAGLEKILRQCEPAAVITDRDSEVFATIPVRLGLNSQLWEEAISAAPFGEWTGIDVDPVSLVFTSGSTGEPRGVTLTHDNISFVVAAIQDRLRYRPEDVIGGFLPLSFDYGLYQVFLAAISGAAIYIGNPSQAGPHLPRILADEGISVLPGVPTLYAALMKLHARRPFELPRLRAITNTGERLPLAYIDKLREMFPGLSVFVMFGLTECKRVSILLPEEFANGKNHTVGRPLRGTEVYAVDEEGRCLPAGEAGELVVRGRHVALGYWRAPEETARRFRKRAPESAVELFTGDRGSVDAEGFISFAARADDLMKHRGNRISPVEIENAACALPGLLEAGVLKREADDTLHLFITTTAQDGWAPEPVLRGLAAVLEPFKVPDFVHRLDQMPKSINGKLDRHALRARLTA